MYVGIPLEDNFVTFSYIFFKVQSFPRVKLLLMHLAKVLCHAAARISSEASTRTLPAL